MDSKTFNEILAVRLNVDEDKIERLTSAMCAVIAHETLESRQVVLPGFGTFETRKRDERISTHPSSGVRMLVPPRLTLTFRPAASLKQKVRNFIPTDHSTDHSTDEQ